MNPKNAVLLNASRLDFGGKLSLGSLETAISVSRYEDSTPEQILERAIGCAVLITKELPMPAEIVSRLPAEVELICEAGTGHDNIDHVAAKRRNIVVCNVPNYSTEAVAQLTMYLLLALSTGAHRVMRRVASDDFSDFYTRLGSACFEVHGKTLGVIGAGRIGSRVVSLARAFGMNVVVNSRTPRKSKDNDAVTHMELINLLQTSDFVSLHCPLSAATHHLICAATLGEMKRGAFLINTARGKLINQADLAAAISAEQLSGAALDVQDPEPLPKDNILWSLDNVLLTPHMGWKALEARQRLIEGVADNIQAFLEGKPINVV